MANVEKVDFNNMRDRDVFKQLVSLQYAPHVEDDMVQCETLFRTSLELQHEFKELCEPSIADISSVMMELNFKSKPFDNGRLYWILHVKSHI